MTVRPVPKEAKMNKAAETQVKTGHYPPAKPAGVGNETKPDVQGAQLGQPTDGMRGHLAGAVGELKSQHPHEYHDHGPHHGTSAHVRHQPLHGLKKG